MHRWSQTYLNNTETVVRRGTTAAEPLVVEEQHSSFNAVLKCTKMKQ